MKTTDPDAALSDVRRLAAQWRANADRTRAAGAAESLGWQIDRMGERDDIASSLVDRRAQTLCRDCDVCLCGFHWYETLEEAAVSIDGVFNSPWARKHDDPHFDLIPELQRLAPAIVYPKSLPELIDLCRNRPPAQRLKAAGSHWALSDAAISEHTFIETNDPRNVHRAMGRTLRNVIPKCLNRDYLAHKRETEGEMRTYLFHVESGKRIYQLYAEMDQVLDVGDRSTLAATMNQEFGDPHYGGPWAFPTLGGAGGQTVVGALNTGTHGGDFDRAPLADAVVALHLVADGGKHYWIEAVDQESPQLTDDFMMSLEFRTDEYGGPDNFEIIRDNSVLDAVLVSAGRFGVIYSVVLTAVPQYALHERRRLVVWQDIKEQIKDRNGPLFNELDASPAKCRFLQVVVCLTPHGNFVKNLAGVTKRWEVPAADPLGRKERVGEIVDPFDERTQGPLFANAGSSHPYAEDPDNPGHAGSPGMLDRACADAHFLRGVIAAAIDEIEQFVNTSGAVVGGGIAAVGETGGIGLSELISDLLQALPFLKDLLEAFDSEARFGEVMEHVKNIVLLPGVAGTRGAGVFIWQLIAFKAFTSQQDEQDYDAISYAVMDRHDYLDVSCNVNVDSIEVFFDATDDRLIAFIDALIAFEMMQEFRGKAFMGYAALRFTKRSRALIGMQKFDTSCSVEVACLKDVSGSQELINYAVALACNPNINGLLHWGQRNDYTTPEVERIYGDDALRPGGNLAFWRRALSRVTDNGRLDGFSSEFTRNRGLEVVRPSIQAYTVEPRTAVIGDTITISWSCMSNPAGTEVFLQIADPSEQVVDRALPPEGEQELQVGQLGTYTISLHAILHGDTGDRTDEQTRLVTVT